MEPGGYFGSSGVLFNVAKRAYERTKSASSDVEPDQCDTLVAVLFAAATLEALINDLPLFAEVCASLCPPTSPVHRLAAILNEAEGSCASIRLKYLLAKVVLSGAPYDKGARPYQDFDLLFRIRDAIVHLKPEKIKEEAHKIVQAVRRLDLCEKEDPHVKSSLLYQIETRAVARWACNVVVDMADSIKECLPGRAEGADSGLAVIASACGNFSRVR